MLGEQYLQVVLSTDDHDFTDFCYASVRHKCAEPKSFKIIAKKKSVQIRKIRGQFLSESVFVNS